jgi:molybdopterin converting factor subunit 1
MTVTLLLFAAYADVFGSSSVELEMSAGATVSELLDQVRELDGAERLPPEVLVAVNEEYATVDYVLEPGDEVALIPPVAGG